MLYNKYRPRGFGQVVGQPSAISLKNSAMSEKPFHSVLLTGTRGIGKTSLARIYAMAVNCSSKETRPCMKCDSCRKKRHPDIVEVDSSVHGNASSLTQMR